MNFYQKSTDAMQTLNQTEKDILVYVMKNINTVKKQSIRELADSTFVSTTTIFRFVKKLGYEGYSDFIYSLIETEASKDNIDVPAIVKESTYSESYLKNIIEAVNIITPEKFELFKKIMNKDKKTLIIAEGLTREVGRYVYHLLSVLEYDVCFPVEEYEKKLEYKYLKDDDVLLVFSYTGNNKSISKEIERAFSHASPKVISFTRADNNSVQNMSDLNFYVFADEIKINDNDITSRIGMIAIIETLIYKLIEK